MLAVTVVCIYVDISQLLDHFYVHRMFLTKDHVMKAYWGSGGIAARIL
jgi:hypothetical protein